MIVYATELRLFVGWRIEGISYENAYYKILFIVLWVKDYQRAFHIVLFHLFCSPTAVSLCACRHSNEEYCFYSTFDRITSGEVPIRVMAEIL